MHALLLRPFLQLNYPSFPYKSHTFISSIKHHNSPPITAMTSTTTTKEVLADLSPVMKVYADGTVERLFSSPHVPPSLEDPVSSKDVTISPSVSARIFLPKLTQTDQKLPVLVYYHAGGFCVESAFSFFHHRYISILSAAAGALVVSVDYRLVPEHPLPAAYEDSWDALKWVCSHGSKIDQTSFKKDEWISNHGDLNRVFVGGDSAGGNIAHNIALRVGSDPLPGNLKITGAILSHPFFLGSDPIGTQSKEEIEQSVSYKMWMLAYPSAAGGIDNPLINPLVNGAPGLSGLGCSKIIVCLTEKDEMKGRGLAYAEEVKKSGWKGEIEVVEIEGEDHCFQLFDPENEKAKYLIKRLAAFISN